MALRYQTGEEIKKGDRVLFHGNRSTIKLVAFEPGDPETDWLIQEYGGGVMVLERVSGRTFVTADQLPDCEDLEFVSRTDDSETNEGTPSPL